MIMVMVHLSRGDRCMLLGLMYMMLDDSIGIWLIILRSLLIRIRRSRTLLYLLWCRTR